MKLNARPSRTVDNPKLDATRSLSSPSRTRTPSLQWIAVAGDAMSKWQGLWTATRLGALQGAAVPRSVTALALQGTGVCLCARGIGQAGLHLRGALVQGALALLLACRLGAINGSLSS